MESVQIMKDLVCSNPYIDGAENRYKIITSKFKEQLGRWRLVQRPSKNPGSVPKFSGSGKVDKDGKISSSFQDDVAMAFFMNIFLWEQLIERNIPTFDYARVFSS